jgi:hypothetical protein
VVFKYVNPMILVFGEDRNIIMSNSQQIGSVHFIIGIYAKDMKQKP